MLLYTIALWNPFAFPPQIDQFISPHKSTLSSFVPSSDSASTCGTKSISLNICLADSSALAASGAKALALPMAIPPKMMAENALKNNLERYT